MRALPCLNAFGLALVVAASAFAQNTRPEDWPVNEFRRWGSTFVCTSKASPDSKNDIDPCLRLGPFGIGDPRGTTEARLGQPDDILPASGGAETHIYFLKGTYIRDLTPYLAVTYARNRVTALQVSGSQIAAPLAFSSLRPGDPKSKLQALFGEPTRWRPVPAVDGEQWDYHPFPFSFELHQGRIVSILIHEFD